MDSVKENELQLMTAAVDRIEAAVKTVLTKNAAHRDENNALRASISAGEKKLAAAEQQVKQISETANALQKKSEDWKRKFEELEHLQRLSATDLERTRLVVQSRETDLQGVTDALAESQREAERFRTELDAMREEHAEGRRAIEAMEHESGSYATMLAQRDAVIAAREEEINSLAAQVEQGTQQIMDLKHTLEQSRADLATLGDSNVSGGSLFSHEERDMMAERIRELVGKLDRYLA